MRTVYDCYGLAQNDLENAAHVLGQVLTVRFTYRESDFLGEYFRGADAAGNRFSLQSNYFDGEEAWNEPDFKEYPILLYVKGAGTTTEIERLLTAALGDRITLLWRRVLDSSQ